MFKGRDRLKTIIKRDEVLRPQNRKQFYAIDCKLNRCSKNRPKQSSTPTNIEAARFDYLFFLKR
jgi:hypothetical protein